MTDTTVPVPAPEPAQHSGPRRKRGGLRIGARRPPPAPRPPRPGRPRPAGGSSARARVPLAKRLKGLGQLVALPLSLHRSTRLDALALAEFWPPIADALEDTAKEVPQLAVILERVAAAGPYGALITAVSPLVAQIAVNHGLPIQIGAAMGAVPPELLMARAAVKGRRDAAQQAAQIADWQAEMERLTAELAGTDAAAHAA